MERHWNGDLGMDSRAAIWRRVMRFRKKPVVIEAIHFTEAVSRDRGTWPPWLREAWDHAGENSGSPQPVVGSVYPQGDALLIATLEGLHKCNAGDWIIRGIKGELYPCKPDIFEATYEAVE